MSDAERVHVDDSELVSTGLLSFYYRLRERFTASLEARAGRGGKGLAEVLLLVPDVFILLARLALDKSVPTQTRTLMAGALAYFLMPVDLLPEAFLGPGAFAEDLVIAVAVLAKAFGGELEPYAERYWNGSEKLRDVIGAVSQIASELLGASLYERVRKLLGKWGIDLAEVERSVEANHPIEDEAATPTPSS